MRKIIIHFIILILLGVNSAWAQLSPYQSHQDLYNEAKELFDKQLYGMAQKKIDDFLSAEELIRSDRYNDLHVNAKFMQAVSAYHTQHPLAEEMLTNFVRTYDENTKAPLGRYYLAKLYVDQKDYERSVEPLLAAYNEGGLPQQQLEEVIFLLGYSYSIPDKNRYADDLKAERFLSMASATPGPYQEDAKYYYALLLYRNGDYSRAYAALSTLENSGKYGDEIRVYLAYTLYELKRYDELFALAEGIPMGVGSQRQDAEVFVIVANTYYELRDYPNSIRYFTEFERNRLPMTRVSNYRYAYSLYKLDRYIEAIPVFQRILTANDSIGQAGSYYLGFCFLETGDPESAKFAFYKAAQPAVNVLNPVDPTIREDAMFQYAKVCFATGDYEEARKNLDQLLDATAHPGFASVSEARGILAEIYFYSKNYLEAIRFFEQSRETPSARARAAYQNACFNYGVDLYNEGKYRPSITYLQKAVRESADPNLSNSAQYWIAEALFREDRFRQARNAYTEYSRMSGVQRNRYYKYTNYAIGWTYFKEKNYDRAYRSFDQFIRSAGPEFPKVPLIDANLRAGDCRFLQRRYGEAIAYYQQVRRINYAFQDYSLYQIAEAYYRQRKYQNSVDSYNQLVRNHRDSKFRDDALDKMSSIYANWLNNYQRSAQFAEMLIKDYPRNPLVANAYNRLGIAAFNQSRNRDAVKFFKKVLTDYPNDKENTQVALDNLGSLVSPSEYDRILRDFRNRNPQNDNLASVTFNTALERYYSGNYSAAISQLTSYIQDYPSGEKYIEALLFRARSQKELNNASAALRDYKAVYDATPATEFTFPALQEAAEMHYERRDYRSGVQLYGMLRDIALEPQNRAQAALGMADGYMNLGEYDNAKQVLQAVVNDLQVEENVRLEADVLIGMADYEKGSLAAAFQRFTRIEKAYDNEKAAQSQFMITQILFDQGKYEEAYQAGVDMKNNYPSYNYWKARAFLVVAEANYALGEIFQAKGTLQSLVDQTRDRFPDVFEMASRRLAEIEEEERRNNALTPTDSNQ